MALLNRTLAIKAALGAGFLLILLNLLNSKLDSSIASNLGYSDYGITHSPKRTHTSSQNHSVSSKENGDEKCVTLHYRDEQPTNNNISIVNRDSSKQSQNASTLMMAVGFSMQLNQSTGGKDINLPQNNETESLGSSVVMQNDAQKLATVVKQEKMAAILNEVRNGKANNSTIVVSLNDISSTSRSSSIRTTIMKSRSTRKSGIDKKNQFNSLSHEKSLFHVNTIATISTPNKVAESHTSVLTKQEWVNDPSRTGQSLDVTIDSRRAQEDTLRNDIDKFARNSCPPIPPNLDGPIAVDVSYEPLSSVEKRYAEKLQPGGQYEPLECTARSRVAIIVPYRDREQHLPIFLKNMHALLMKQQLDYGIYIVEQTAGSSFNRAALMNIGFVEATKQKNWECMVFHDIDLLPLDDRNLYTCPDQPRHMSVAVDTFSFKLPYSTIFGGVSAMTEKQFRMVNGFSNSFWGWGGEDDDMSNRLKHVGFHIARYPINIARYTMLNHKKEKANPKRYEKLVNGAKRYDIDGLNSLHYQLVNLIRKPLYTWIHVEITPDGS